MTNHKPIISAINRTSLIVVCALVFSTSAMGQTLSVREFVAQKIKWAEWSLKRKAVSISGRYEGRLSKQFRFSRLPMLITPQRTTVLPNNLKAGQRVTVSGVLHRSGSRYGLEVTRIAIGSTDTERMIRKVDRAASDNPEAMYEIADEYAEIAEFYEDKELTFNITKLREKAFGLQRDQNKNDPAGLLRLAVQAEKTGVPTAVVEAIRFQSLVVAANLPESDMEKVLVDMRQQLKGWDRNNAMLDARAEERFLQNPVAEYETADKISRQRMHRRVYRIYRLPQIIDQLQPDAANGIEVVRLLERELPEETVALEKIKTEFVDARLAAVSRLNRSQLEELGATLREFGRQPEMKQAIKQWLKVQEERQDNGELDGILYVADVYQFVFERWKDPAHRLAEDERLKTAWFVCKDAAPQEAKRILQRLERHGWTRLSGKWMTVGEVNDLPPDDVELARREGRVVPGMKAHQITSGVPTRRIRIISSRYVEEIWVYEEAGSTAITIHLQRDRHSSSDMATVTQVSTVANR